jgi:hypothetical protein
VLNRYINNNASNSIPKEKENKKEKKSSVPISLPRLDKGTML